jgi:hypothetical protein
MDEFLQRQQLGGAVYLLSIAKVRADGRLENRQTGRVPFAEETRIEIVFGDRSVKVREISHVRPLLHDTAFLKK